MERGKHGWEEEGEGVSLWTGSSNRIPKSRSRSSLGFSSYQLLFLRWRPRNKGSIRLDDCDSFAVQVGYRWLIEPQTSCRARLDCTPKISDLSSSFSLFENREERRGEKERDLSSHAAHFDSMLFSFVRLYATNVSSRMSKIYKDPRDEGWKGFFSRGRLKNLECKIYEWINVESCKKYPLEGVHTLPYNY